MGMGMMGMAPSQAIGRAPPSMPNRLIASQNFVMTVTDDQTGTEQPAENTTASSTTKARQSSARPSDRKSAPAADQSGKPTSKSAKITRPKEPVGYGGRTFDEWRTELLTDLEPETRIKALLRASSDDDFNVRYIAMRLAEEHFETAPERLRLRAVALLEDEEPDVRIAAAIFLGHAGDERAKPLLRRIVRGELPAQREDEREAVELVGALAMRDLVPDLERRAFGVGRHVRDTCSFHAIIALARMGHARAVESIKRDLSSRSEKRREAATVAAERARLA